MRGWRIAVAAANLVFVAGQALAQGAPQPDAVWNLDGGGELSIVDQDAALEALDARLAAQSATVDLTGAPDGAVTSCNEARGVPHSSAAKDLCRALLSGGRFRQQQGLELPANVRLRVRGSAQRIYRPAQPIRFGGPAERIGAAVFKQWPDGKCSVVAHDLAEEDGAGMCAAWIAAGKPGLLDSATDEVKVSVLPDLLAPAVFRRDIAADMPRNDGPVTNALGDPPVEARLGEEMGSAKVLVGTNDYPARALRAAIGANVRVWIGFGRNGKPGSCRPAESSNGAYLANVACLIVLRRARFYFAPGTPDFQGLRYLSKTIKWTIPVR